MRRRVCAGYDPRVIARAFPLIIAAVCVALAACSGGSNDATPTAPPGATVAPPPGAVETAAAAPRPDGVPADALPFVVDAEFGSRAAPPGADPATTELFFSMSCKADVLAIATNRRALYAELPCDRALPQDVVARFLGKPVQTRITVAAPAKLFLDSADAGSAQFTVGRVWMVELQPAP